MRRIDMEAGHDEMFQQELRQQLNETEQRLVEEEKAKLDLKEQVYKLNRQLEDSSRKGTNQFESNRSLEEELKLANRRLQIEMVAATEIRKKYAEGLKEWK